MATRLKYTVNWQSHKGRTLNSHLGEIIIPDDGMYVTYDKTMFDFLSRFKDAKGSLENEDITDEKAILDAPIIPETLTEEQRIILEQLNQPSDVVSLTVVKADDEDEDEDESETDTEKPKKIKKYHR